MPQVTWKGVITFGLVGVPVQPYAAGGDNVIGLRAVPRSGVRAAKSGHGRSTAGSAARTARAPAKKVPAEKAAAARKAPTERTTAAAKKTAAKTTARKAAPRRAS
ncbi:hypothetical protein [Kitasatospora sp. NPDC093679]|uniref:hypothetical protein n=1 Tax=Kitasatospora sp. NPDC093679 TaxID=3154983 RepID=UPI0034168657